MANILFIDDSPERYNVAFSILQATNDNLNIYLASNVKSSIRLLCDTDFDLVIMDVFMPLGDGADEVIGKRADMYVENLQHMGSLELLDFLRRMDERPIILMHTACFDHNVISVFNEIIDDRIPKPAPVEVFIKSITEALNL
jgi:CheY-like chemotaxis protein